MVVLSDTYLSDLFGKSSTDAQKSHLSLARKNITKLELLNDHCTFQLVDLRNNALRTAKNIRNQTCLTYLFLQSNSIRSLEGFASLRCLETLYLDGNRIEVIEGLDGCPLKKLSISGQRLEKGQTLVFDPITMKALGFHLEMLIVSSNNLLSVRPLQYLQSLECLDASENRLADPADLTDALSPLVALKALDLLGNPAMKKKSSVKRLVALLPSLETLNGLEVTGEMHSACKHMLRTAEAGDGLDGQPHQRAKALLQQRCRQVPGFLRPKLTSTLIDKLHQNHSGDSYIDDNITYK